MPEIEQLPPVVRTPARPRFSSFVAPPPKATRSRTEFAGLLPKEAVERLLESLANRDLRPITLRQKRTVLTHILTELAGRGIDLASVCTEDLALYRIYLADLVEQGVISCNYAAHQVIQWNATMRAVFGESGFPGTGLVMRGFKQTPRLIEHLTQEDFAALLEALPEKRWQNRHYRELMHTYLEVSWCAAARIGSLATEKLTVADVDFDRGVLHLRRVKNRPDHYVVLSERAVNRLHWWLGFLQGRPHWRGRETPLLMGPRQGRVIPQQTVNRYLHELAAKALLNKNVTSHVFRKSVGTLMALENAKLAQEQLGITEKVFNRHYNQPLLEDRLAHREILPSVTSGNPSPEEGVGAAYLRYRRGEITQAQLDQVVLLARLAAVDPRRKLTDSAYA